MGDTIEQQLLAELAIDGQLATLMTADISDDGGLSNHFYPCGGSLVRNATPESINDLHSTYLSILGQRDYELNLKIKPKE